MFFGSIPALVTPFCDGKVDVRAFRAFVEWQISNHSQALVPCGTTGEGVTLELDEHKLVVETCINQAQGRVPVIAGAGSNATHRAVILAQIAKQAGADAVLVAAPWYNKPSQQGILAHFTEINKVGIPVLVYNVPRRTMVDISVATLGEIAKLSHVIGVKDATGNIERVAQQRNACGDGFIQVSGDDGTALDFYRAGGLGCISVTANVFPRQCAAVQTALRENNIALAQELDTSLQAAHAAMFIDASPAPAKYALAKLGFMQNELRLPMVPANTHAQTVLDQVLSELAS
ncbi:MAG: 4-hydroxy-tetrahydrodipicolinate synthase [Robiginitomaculum sp.]|nr:4-hydroxy-tetrahydrodipicolinate synthase [Robiginitomaculum sp.]